jgi:hypothetical protein
MMVKVHTNTTDKVAAWRVRDALAAHPLLGGATAQISVVAHLQGIVLDGWVIDDQVMQVAIRLANHAAGQRAVQAKLCTTKRPVTHCSREVRPGARR